MKFDVLKDLHEWQEIVGDVVIGKGLSYQCEIEGVIEDTVEAAIAFERKRILEEAEKRAFRGSPGAPLAIWLSNLKEILGGQDEI